MAEDFRADEDVVNRGPNRLTKKSIARNKAIKKRMSLSQNSEDENANAQNARRTSLERVQLSTKYQKKTQYEHIILRPDTYIGSTEPVRQNLWVFENGRMVQRSVSYVPGLYKIFDEILVNASDNKQRDPKGMRNIKVNISSETGEISVWNDGKGIPIELHREHGIYIPELVFGHLMTGENFHDKDERVVGGRNGYGAKLTNIFSSEFEVETNDSRSGKRYSQRWSSNMSEKHEPSIVKASGKDYTCVTFTPDYERFGMNEGIDQDTIALLTKRVYDVAGVTDSSVKVSLNGKQLNISGFSDYIDLYLNSNNGNEENSDSEEEDDDSDFEDERPKKGKGKSKPLGKLTKVFENVNERWQVCIAASPDGQMQHISFVNGICTTKGGQHVNYIADQVASYLQTTLKKKQKGGTELKPHQVKSHLWLFVNALIVNPAFDSQTKDTLTTVKTKFGPANLLPKLKDSTLKSIERTPIVENILYWAKAKEMKELGRKAGGTKTSKIKGIDKLDDANFAGGRNSRACTLILTEGNSAKTLAISGLSVVGRDYYGVFPLRGKLLNVRDASHSQIMKNEEIQSVMKILGLQPGKTYTDTKELRYGHIMIMTDQDHDGSHIKGLIMNFVHHFWPSLLQMESFLQVFITPIVKVFKGTQSHSFYTMPQYIDWSESLDSTERKRWNIRYYKGLGTSTAKEAKEYFADIERNRINMVWEGERAENALQLAFSKKKVSERKDWLHHFKPGTFIDFDVDSISYGDFVDQELILFSMADNIRSIPSIADGLKPSQRKVLFCCIKRKLTSDIKVAQLVGYISEHSAYHHGEASLASTILGMAQTFVGSNNINILFPSGQFGSRIMGGKDAASPRYIFTRLAKHARHIFHPQDDAVLKYLDDDGLSIEPDYYHPVIPMLLVNGASGIGTGWSTDIPCYNPRDLIDWLRQKIHGGMLERRLHPWYRGFAGTIEEDLHPTKGFTGRYKTRGLFDRDEDEQSVIITELPVGVWTQNYKQFLCDEKNFPDGFIRDIRENHTDRKVSFKVVLSSEAYRSVEDDDKLLKLFKLEAYFNVGNMIAFNYEGVITKYNSAEDVLTEFFHHRLKVYELRKNHIVRCLEKESRNLSNKARFISMVVNGELVITKKKKAEILNELVRHGFDQFSTIKNSASELNDEQENDANADIENEAEDSPNLAALSKGYDYLLSMALWTLTKERVDALLKEHENKQMELEAAKAKTHQEMWIDDLNALSEALDHRDMVDEQEEALEESQRQGGKTKTKRTISKKVAPKKTSKPLTSKEPTPSSRRVDPSEQGQEIEVLSLAERLKTRMVVSPAVSRHQQTDSTVSDDKPAGTDSKKRTKKPAASRTKAPSKTEKSSLIQGMKDLTVASSKSSTATEKSKIGETLTPAAKDNSKRRRLKTAEKSAKPTTKGRAPKKVVSSSSDSESEMTATDFSDESDDEEVTPPPRRAPMQRRAQVKKSYVVDDSESDDVESEYDDSE